MNLFKIALSPVFIKEIFFLIFCNYSNLILVCIMTYYCKVALLTGNDVRISQVKIYDIISSFLHRWNRKLASNEINLISDSSKAYILRKERLKLPHIMEFLNNWKNWIIKLPVGSENGWLSRENKKQHTTPVGIWYQNDVVSASMRRHHAASTLIGRHFTSCVRRDVIFKFFRFS